MARKDAKQARRTRQLLSARLKIMLADLGLTPEKAGKMLHVMPRTVRYWISGSELPATFRATRANECGDYFY